MTLDLQDDRKPVVNGTELAKKPLERALPAPRAAGLPAHVRLLDPFATCVSSRLKNGNLSVNISTWGKN